MRDFEKWLGTMRECINGYDYYVNFQKVYENAERFKAELNLMNSLIGSTNIHDDFENLAIKYPSVLHCIPTLLAVRQSEIYAQDDTGAHIYNFLRQTNSLDEYIIFMEKTGLFDLIANHLINNLYDYAIGVEVGLDSNGRKNRGGHQMENFVESYIKKAGVEYYKEMYIAEIEEKWNLDLSMISGENTSTKRWDFVVKTSSKVFLIETNFYASSGSKLNETSRSYKMIAEEATRTSGIEFVWITDGLGWKDARRNLHETFNSMEHLYNLSDLENGILTNLFS